MKKIFYTLLTLILFQTACGDSESEPDAHEIGDWGLDSFILSNLPLGFSYQEGRVIAVPELSFGGVFFEAYEITFANNGTYSRRIEVTGPNINDDGTWEYDGDDLTLFNPEGDEEVYPIEKNASDQLWWSTEVPFGLIDDETIDSLQSLDEEAFNAITDEEFNAFFSTVTLDLVYAFERQ
jgi:hypothetical protein